MIDIRSEKTIPMGNSTGSTVAHNPTTVERKTQLSELYVACANNDVDLARALLETTPFDMINTPEMNGSTALHCAVQAGHTEIVRMLLCDYEVYRHRLDGQGRTAYELAQTDQMLQFFRRPSGSGSRCFSEATSSGKIAIIDSNGKDQPPSGRVEGQPAFLELRKYHMDHVYTHYGGSRNPKLKISSDQWILEQRDILMAIVDQLLTPNDRIYPKVNELLREYAKDGRPEHLVRLFTLESPFYETINQSKATSEQLAKPIFNALSFVRKRAYKGQAYRGLAMTRKDIADYHWAAKVSSRVLIFNTFSSMTRDRQLAEGIARARAHPPKLPVLMIFNFPQKCLTTIQLERLSSTLPAITEHEDEEEILILPRTAFYVEQVVEDSSITTIHLKHCFWLDQEADDYCTEIAYIIST